MSDYVLENLSLPPSFKSRCFEIRLESIGGLGANLCGKLLGQLGCEYLGFNVTAFSSYGSEKRGAPVRSYVRWARPEMEILSNSPIENPDMLVIFHEALSHNDMIAAGTNEDSIIIVNTDKTPKEIRNSLRIYAATVCCIDALKFAMQSKSRINMVMLGAVCKASGFIKLDEVKRFIANTLSKKYPAMSEANLLGLEMGYNNIITQKFEPDGQYEKQEYKEIKNKWGYKNAPIGGVNTQFGSTVSNELSASREGYIPLFIFDKCIHCGLCDSTCPDMVFQFTEGVYKGKKTAVNRGLDYHHCKGCLRCVDVCPTEALVAGNEREYPEKKWFVRNKDLIAEHIDFDVAGADPWITSEAYLDEKRVDGGLV